MDWLLISLMVLYWKYTLDYTFNHYLSFFGCSLNIIDLNFNGIFCVFNLMLKIICDALFKNWFSYQLTIFSHVIQFLPPFKVSKFSMWTALSNCASITPMKNCSNCSTIPCLSTNKTNTWKRVSSGISSILASICSRRLIWLKRWFLSIFSSLFRRYKILIVQYFINFDFA